MSLSESLDPTDSKLEDYPVDDTATPEHCFHAFDALYCALTDRDPIPPKFVDEK